jgi:hypothetical protein
MQELNPPTPSIERDPDIYPKKTTLGQTYKFTPKHHHNGKSEHACWLSSIGRATEFGLFQDAETGRYSDDRGNLYNVHKDGDEYLEIGTRHELMAIFWKPHPPSEWHGHPRWPVKTRDQFNRGTQGYRPSKTVMQKMVDRGRMSQRDADRVLRGDHP